MKLYDASILVVIFAIAFIGWIGGVASSRHIEDHSHSKEKCHCRK